MSALPPPLAVSYLRALSCDVRAVELRDPAGAVLAEDGVLAGDVVRARQDDHEIAVAIGPHALGALARHDAEQALEAVLHPPHPA
ncbi:MAG TPA: hypothetical protein VGJ32_06580 [Solirubrobacteraceae bacterium]|jgi:hypothetical protein